VRTAGTRRDSGVDGGGDDFRCAGLAAGIIIDATVTRAFLVPALTSMMGKWNWWLPSWLKWIAPKPVAVTPSSTSTTPAAAPGE